MSSPSSTDQNDPISHNPDRPNQSLYSAIMETKPHRRPHKIDNLRQPQIAERAEDALREFSWAHRSVLQLPLATQSCIMEMNRYMRIIEQTLLEFDKNIWCDDCRAARCGCHPATTPTQSLSKDIRNRHSPGIKAILDLVQKLKPEHLMLLKPGNGAFEPRHESIGSALVKELIKDQCTNCTDIFDDYVGDLACLTACMDKVDILEQLVENRRGLGALRRASKALTLLKVPITYHYRHGVNGETTYKLKSKNPETHSFLDDLNRGRLCSAVASMCTQSRAHDLALSILSEAWQFCHQEHDTDSPQPKETINILHRLYAEAQQAGAVDATAYIMTGFCSSTKLSTSASPVLLTDREAGSSLSSPVQPTDPAHKYDKDSSVSGTPPDARD